MRFDVLTIFPKIFDSFKSQALIFRAQKKKLISIHAYNLRDWTSDNHQTVDGRPYGGGAGMVMLAEPIRKAVSDLRKRKAQKVKVVVFSAKGRKFEQSIARQWARLDRLILICGRYEGIDERVVKHIADEEISIGDYVLFGGEVPAMVVMEAVTRLLPGAVGKEQSIIDESFSANLVEHPHYSRPESIKLNGKNRRVPKILLTGNHKKIREWRWEQSIKSTKKYRPYLQNPKIDH